MLCVFGEDLPSADAIRSLPPEKSRVLVYGTGFDDQKDPNIKLEKGFHWAPVARSMQRLELICVRQEICRVIRSTPGVRSDPCGNTFAPFNRNVP